MPSSGNSRLIARCCADFAGDLAADPEAIKTAVTTFIAGGGLVVGGVAAAPVVVPLVLFLGLNALVHGIEQRDKRKTATELRAFLDSLFDTLQQDMGEVDTLLTETYIGQQIESQDLRERLNFINEIVKQNADAAESIDIRTDRIEQMLINHPDHTARFEHVLKEHYEALDGKLDKQQEGIVFAAFGNEVLYLGIDALKQLIIERHKELQDGQEILNLQHEKIHEALAESDQRQHTDMAMILAKLTKLVQLARSLSLCDTGGFQAWRPCDGGIDGHSVEGGGGA